MVGLNYKKKLKEDYDWQTIFGELMEREAGQKRITLSMHTLESKRKSLVN